ncbi:hypothetical protein SAMN05444392_102462 [Seinonella peptonophila]|uniref:Uncharacterized protein n=1 Tax=Seinonella peptonophila TaxID=112248 RepID=A0A1M4VPM5_9BACL|nr:hypothetical protein [Seinonella peptonophila]SHE70800.1 hypothetical protein SAMN05444392_102462 [Seinonella peptonophila]
MPLSNHSRQGKLRFTIQWVLLLITLIGSIACILLIQFEHDHHLVAVVNCNSITQNDLKTDFSTGELHFKNTDHFSISAVNRIHLRSYFPTSILLASQPIYQIVYLDQSFAPINIPQVFTNQPMTTHNRRIVVIQKATWRPHFQHTVQRVTVNQCFANDVFEMRYDPLPKSHEDFH